MFLLREMNQLTKIDFRLPKTKAKTPPTREHALVADVLEFFGKQNITFKEVYFGMIKTIGYQKTFENFQEAKIADFPDRLRLFRWMKNRDKKEIIWK